MADCEIFNDTPVEPSVHAVKTSLISRQQTASSRLTDNFQRITIEDRLGKAKFPVYLASSKFQNKKYAMKMFPISDRDQDSSLLFKNEIRFSSFSHQNIIKMLHIENEKEFGCEEDSDKVSYILMEYASHGDLHRFAKKYQKHFDEKLARTYFRQLIEGLEYFHSRGAAHLDIKLDNLLIDENFILKIADFDMSSFLTDTKVLSKGTRFYRAPELMETKYKVSQESDIYSAGVILFALMCGGVLPHTEDRTYKGFQLLHLLNNHNSEFWRAHCKIQNKEESSFGEDFKELFISMVKLNPKERTSIEEIKKSKWYNGAVYTSRELKSHIESFLKS